MIVLWSSLLVTLVQRVQEYFKGRVRRASWWITSTPWEGPGLEVSLGYVAAAGRRHIWPQQNLWKPNLLRRSLWESLLPPDTDYIWQCQGKNQALPLSGFLRGNVPNLPAGCHIKIIKETAAIVLGSSLTSLTSRSLSWQSRTTHTLNFFHLSSPCLKGWNIASDVALLIPSSGRHRLPSERWASRCTC